MSEGPDDYGPYVKRAVIAARRCIEAEEVYTQIKDEDRDRAWNSLSYAFRHPKIWADSYKLLKVMIPRMEMAGYREDWIPYLEKGVLLSQTVGDTEAQGELCLAIGYLELLSTNLESAEAWFQQSKQSFRQIRDSSGQGQALNRLAVVQLYRHNYPASLQLAQESLEILPADHRDRANSYYVLGTVCNMEQKWLEAENHYRSALEIWEKVGDQRRIAWAWSNLGQALHNQGNVNDAIHCYKQTMDIFTYIHDPVNRAIVQMNLANSYLKCDQCDAAVQALVKVRRTFLKFGDELNLARATLNLGVAYAALQKWRQAKEAYHESIRLWERLGITASLCNAIDGLGETYLGDGEYDKAIDVFEDGLLRLEQIAAHPRYKNLKKMLKEHLNQTKERQGAK